MQIVRVVEQRGVAAVRADVIDFGGHGDDAGAFALDAQRMGGKVSGAQSSPAPVIAACV